MTTWKKILLGSGVVFLAAVAALAVAISRDEACAPAADPPTGVETMRALQRRCYGDLEVLELATVAKPVPGDDQVLVRVHAAAVNPLDLHYLTGKPYLMRLSSGLGAPKEPRLGVDYAGTVEEVGRNVTRFKPGDQVFGGRTGALADYVVVGENRAIAIKPVGTRFEQAASVGIAGITALQALRDSAGVEAGDKVLVNGASGGVGTFTVQIGKALGAEVTGVQSTRNLELVRSLGADHVIDYTRENFTEGDARYDVIVDNVGNHPLLALRRVLAPDGIVVAVSGPKDNPWIGPFWRILRASALSAFVSQDYNTLLSEFRQADLETLAGMMAAGQVTPVIDREYPLEQAVDALAYLETGRARGKVIVVVSPPEGDLPAEPVGTEESPAS